MATNAEYIRKQLKAQGLKQRWLADQCGTSEVHISRILCGSRTLSKRMQKLFAMALGVPEKKLITTKVIIRRKK